MHPEIASLHERMAQGGDWRTFQQEIARLNKEAETQQEYVTVLEAHRNLIAVAEHCFPPETYKQIKQIGQGEYQLFLSVEAMEGELINPVMLDQITAREVASGRMWPEDEYRKFAAAGGSVLGDSADCRYDRKLGDRIGIGGLILGALAFFLVSEVLGVAVALVGMGVGWFINEKRKKQSLEEAQFDRATRGYERPAA
jgi:hypothetical protein